jgi:hypothetical protein
MKKIKSDEGQQYCEGSRRLPHSRIEYATERNSFYTQSDILAAEFFVQGCTVRKIGMNIHEVQLKNMEYNETPKKQDHVCISEPCDKCGQDHCKCSPCTDG